MSNASLSAPEHGESVRTTSLRFGILTFQDRPYTEMVADWRLIESLGFDAVWVADQFADARAGERAWFDGWTWLTALATATQRIRIGTLVTSITLHNPARIALQALTVDHISGGRLELGIGAGRAPLDHGMMGTPVWDPRERSARFREFVEIVDRLLRHEAGTYTGQYYRVEAAAVLPRPTQQPRPPLILAAHGPAGLRLAAEYADGWNSFGRFRASPDEALRMTRERNARLDEYCTACGRDPRAVRRTFLTGFTSDPFLTSRDALQAFVGKYREAGIDEFIFYYIPGSRRAADTIASRRALERLAVEDMPALRAAG
jgi:alkanesulfonate monooxygenase SsuD/methylene tetrahydromethanopterin reductase-like flavin-dependent oxidoreductase (luciferase family)